MRRGLLLGATLGIVNASVVVLLDWALRRRRDLGWFSYPSSPRRYADYLPRPHVVSGWAAVAVITCALIAVNMLVAVGYVFVSRSREATCASS
jgi:hypothetical protein